jgi:dihydropteroate synthase
MRFRDRTYERGGPALVMGILNVTPDSFFDGGRYGAVDAARARAADMLAQGAQIVDVGGRSYGRHVAPVSAAEERARVVPVVEALVRDGLRIALSIDTTHAEVADAALFSGAHLINDCSGLADERMAPTVARYDAGLVIMHLKGRLNVRDAEYRYDDALGEIAAFLRERSEGAMAAGVDPESLVLDPGIEFGKELATDLEILRRFGDFGALGFPLLLAASRKTFLGELVGRPVDELLAASLAAASLGIAAGAAIVRAHDVGPTVDVARVLAAVTKGRLPACT